MPKGKHLGVSITFWASQEEADKLSVLGEQSGLNRTGVLRNLIAGKQLPDKSYWRTCNQIASIGGYIKRFVDNGEHGNAYRLGCELLEIAKELKKLDPRGAE